MAIRAPDGAKNDITLNKMGQYLLTVLEGTKGGVKRRWRSFSKVPLCCDLLHMITTAVQKQRDDTEVLSTLTSCNTFVLGFNMSCLWIENMLKQRCHATSFKHCVGLLRSNIYSNSKLAHFHIEGSPHQKITVSRSTQDGRERSPELFMKFHFSPDHLKVGRI